MPTDRDQSDESRIHPVRSWMSAEDHSEPARFRQVIEPTEEKLNTKIKQDPKSNSDEELTIELMVENQGREYPLREKIPPQISDEECLLLTNEGELESFEEAKRDTHNCKWLSAMQDEMDSLHESHTYEFMDLPKGKRVHHYRVQKWKDRGFHF